MNAKRKKPLLYTLFDKLETMAKNGKLNRISESKAKDINAFINKHLKAFNDKRIKAKLRHIQTRLRRYYNNYLSSGFKANNPHIKVHSIKRIAPTLIQEYKARNLESFYLISTQSNERLGLIKNRIWNWLYEKGDANKLSSTSLRESVNVSNEIAKQDKHFSFILNDQMHKMRGNLDATIAKELKAIAFIWKTRQDKRVVGNPAGLYPNVTNPKAHGNHFQRKDKLFFYHNTYAINKGYINTKAQGFSWADFEDGMPSVPIGCRCYAKNIYVLSEIPKAFITKKGEEFIKSHFIY